MSFYNDNPTGDFMKISVNGAKDKLLSKYLKCAANFYAETLLPKKIVDNITLKIIVHDTLDAGGYCDSEEYSSKNPRDFIIDLSRTKKIINMFITLAHEMVHLKQMANGEMKDKRIKNKYVTVWKGELVEDDISYWDQPWEIEAYGLENSLTAKFLIKYNLFSNLKQSPAAWFHIEAKDTEE